MPESTNKQDQRQYRACQWEKEVKYNALPEISLFFWHGTVTSGTRQLLSCLWHTHTNRDWDWVINWVKVLHPTRHSQRILYKTAVMTRKVLTTGVPAYQKEHLVRHATSCPTRHPPARHVLLHVHCWLSGKQILFARCSLSYAAPVTWNNLPADVMLCNSESGFKKTFKDIPF